MAGRTVFFGAENNFTLSDWCQMIQVLKILLHTINPVFYNSTAHKQASKYITGIPNLPSPLHTNESLIKRRICTQSRLLHRWPYTERTIIIKLPHIQYKVPVPGSWCGLLGAGRGAFGRTLSGPGLGGRFLLGAGGALTLSFLLALSLPIPLR